MNNEDADETPDSVRQAIQQIWKQSPNLPDAVAEELREVLARLQSLPFKNEEQRASLFESFQSLRIQGYHIVQVFKIGVARLEKSVKEPSKFVAKVITLFQMCFNFCYKADKSRRVSFEHYIRALKLCFPSDPKKSCLSIETVSVLLNLVQILQEGKLSAPSFINLTNLGPAKGPKDLFNELLTTLESKPYSESDVDDIISQASRFASMDAKNHTLLKQLKKFFPNLTSQFDQIVPAVFFRHWIDLLQLTKAGDAAFILRVASEDPLHSPSPVTLSPLCYMAHVFQRMKLSGKQVDLTHDEERLDAFFRNINHLFENDYETTYTLLELLSSKNISDAVFAKVCELFFKGLREPQHTVSHKAQTLESIRQLLLVLPEGGLVVRVLSFWIENFPNDSNYAILQRLMDLFTELRTKGSVSKGFFFQERAEQLLNFINSVLPRSTIPLFHSWVTFLGHLIAVLPTSFEKLPGLPNYIGKVAERAASKSNTMTENQDGALSFLNWLSEQRCSVEVKQHMAELFVRCEDPRPGCNLFLVNLIKSLCVCNPLTLNDMNTFIQEMVCFSSHLERNEKDAIGVFVSKVAASDQSCINRQDIFTELCNTIKHLCNDNKAPMKSIRLKTFQIISLLAKINLSSRKTVRLLRLSRNSTDALSCCLRYLQLVSSVSKIPKERASEHFELLFAAFFETLNGDENLCEIFCRHYRSFTKLFTTSCPSVDLLNLWSFVAAGLLSLDKFIEKVDLQGCMPVLVRATGFDSPFHALQLYFLLRSVFSRLFTLSRGRVPGLTFTQARGRDTSLSDATPDLVENFVEASILIVQSDVSPPEAKLLLIDKVCDVGLKKPDVLTGNILCRALGNVIPFHSGIPSEDIPSDHLELRHILTILERPGMLEQLAKISTTPSKSLYSILCSKIPNPIAKDDVVLIFDCVVSFKNADKVFFDHILVLLESITKVCSSVSDVLDLLVEAEGVIREIRPELIPLSILIFSHLVENRVAKEERAAFIKLVALEWESPCDLDMYTDYEIPLLLWNAYQSAKGTDGKFEAIDKIHEVIVRSKNLKTHAPNANITEMNRVQRRILCRDLEWLVTHSSLTCEDVALCFHLSSCYPAVHGLKCFSSVSAMQVQNDCLTPAPLQENEASNTTAEKHPSRVNGGTQGSVSEQATASLLPLRILTPAVIANKMIVQIRRLLGDDLSLHDFGIDQLWNSLFTNHCLPCPDDVCKSSNSSSTCDDFVNVFLSVLEKASYLEVVLFWFVRHPDRIHPFRSQHHAVQCSDVLRESCAWNEESADKIKRHLQIQSEVAATLEVLRSVSEGPILPSLSQAVNYSPICFRLLQPQLKCLLCILQSKLPFEVTLGLLNLTKRDWQAAAAVTAIVSFWSCQRAAAKLLEGVHNLFKDLKIPAFSFQQNEFLWHMFEVWACGESYMNSPEDLPHKLLQLVNFLIPEEPNCGLHRLPEWRNVMIAEGYSVHVIDKWCADFLSTPRDNFSSRDVDAIIDLSSSSLQLAAPVSQLIKQCIFSEVGIKAHPIKERLRLVKILNEFIEVLKIRKPNEASSNIVVTRIVVDACDKLCKSYLDKVTSDNDLYRIRGQTLDALFAEVFVTSDGGRVNSPQCESSIAVVAAGQGKPPSVLTHVEVYDPMLVLLRRWLSNIASKPTLASYTQEIVQLILSQRSTEMGSSVLEELHNKIQNRILSFAPNQILISQLQAAGYNQGDTANANNDLWKSTSVELSCYLSKSESTSKEVIEKKLTVVLRRHWLQWKDLLLMLNIPSIRVGEADVDTKDLFGFQATLKEMEHQVAAVKERICHAHSGDVDPRLVEELTRQEQQHRDRINEKQKRNKVSISLHNCYRCTYTTFVKLGVWVTPEAYIADEFIYWERIRSGEKEK